VETEAEAELHLRGADRCECEGEAKGWLVVTDCTEAKATTGMEAEAAASLPSCYALRSIHAVHNSPISPSRVQQVPTVSCIFLIIFCCQCICYLDQVVYIVIIILCSKFNFTVDLYLDLSSFFPSFVQKYNWICLGVARSISPFSAHGLLKILCRLVGQV